MKENQYQTNSSMESFQLRMLEGYIYQTLKSWETLIFLLSSGEFSQMKGLKFSTLEKGNVC